MIGQNHYPNLDNNHCHFCGQQLPQGKAFYLSQGSAYCQGLASCYDAWLADLQQQSDDSSDQS